MEHLDEFDWMSVAWLVGVCFAAGAVLTLALITWAFTRLTQFIVRRWRKSVWDTAARMLAENQREVENYVAKQELDAIEYREFELRPVEVTPEERLAELTREEAIDGMLAHTTAEIAQGAIIDALRAEIGFLQMRLASKERARARHWATVQRLRAQLSSSSLGDAPPQLQITRNGEHHHEQAS